MAEKITEAEILDVLLGDADPALEARVRQAARHDPRLAALAAQWREVIPPLARSVAPLKAMNARVRDGVMSRLGDAPLAVHFLVDEGGPLAAPSLLRRLRRRLALAGVAALALAGLLGPAAWSRLCPAIRAGRVAGQIRVFRGDGASAPLRAGERIALPLRLQSAVGAEAELALADGSRLRLAGAGEVALEGWRGVRQNSGVADYRVAHRWLAGRFTVRIPQGAIEDVGTAFKVSVSGAERAVVQVGEGRVRITREGGPGVEARAGERAVVAPGATVVEPLPGWTDLAQARAHFQTRLTRVGPVPAPEPLPPPPAGVREVAYHSGGLSLKAWVSAPPAAGPKLPLVVFAHPGFALAARDWAMTEIYRREGFLVLLPMLRGERGNPGHFEGYWGEADDLVAAGALAAGLPGVDPARVYLAGMDEGGTLAALAALLPSRYAAVVSICGAMDLGAAPVAGALPFNLADHGERMLRSAAYFPESIHAPLHLILGDSDAARLPAGQELARQAVAAGKPCQVWIVKGDAQSARTPGLLESVDILKGLLARREE